MFDFYTFTYIISLIISILTIFATIYVEYFQSYILHVLPKALRYVKKTFFIKLALKYRRLLFLTLILIQKNIVIYSFRLYYIFCYIFPVIFGAIFRLVYAITFLIYETENHNIFNILNSISPFPSQILRTFIVTIVIERIVATVYLEKHTFSHKIQLFWFLTIQTFVSTILYVGFICYSKR